MAARRGLSRLLPAGGFGRGLVVLAGGMALGQAVAVCASPVLTRLYTPGELGILTACLSLVSIVATAGALCYDVAIPVPPEDVAGANLLALALVLVSATSLLAALALRVLGSLTGLFAGLPAVRPFLWFVPLGLLAVGYTGAFQQWTVRKRAFGHLARGKLSQNAGQVLAQSAMGLLRIGPLGLLLGDAMGRFGALGMLAVLAWRRDARELRQVSLRGMKQVAARYRRFPLFSSAGNLLNSLGLELPALLLASLYGPQMVGWMALGQRVMVLPLNLIVSPLSQVFVGESARIVHSEPERLWPLLCKMMAGVLALALPYILLLALLAPALFPVVFGPAWREAGVYLRILAPMVLLQSVANPTGGTLDILQRQDLHLMREITRTFLVSGAILLAGSRQIAPRAAVGLYSAAGTVIYVLYLCISVYAVRSWRAGTPESAAGERSEAT